MYNPGMEQHHQARRQSHCVPTSPLQRPGQVGHGGRNPAHRILLRGNACTYDTRCCGKRCVHCPGMVDDRAMSACGARSSGSGLPLPALPASMETSLVSYAGGRTSVCLEPLRYECSSDGEIACFCVFPMFLGVSNVFPKKLGKPSCKQSATPVVKSREGLCTNPTEIPGTISTRELRAAR